MKTFTYYDYREKCPIAVNVENLMNDCGSAESHLEKIKTYFGSIEETRDFLLACIAYWSEIDYYDGRNEFAVFGSREIVKQYPTIKEMGFDEDCLRNAFGFTMSAHRYLQNELFKAVLIFLKEEFTEIWEWWNSKEFVYNEEHNGLIPYADYKKTKNW